MHDQQAENVPQQNNAPAIGWRDWLALLKDGGQPIIDFVHEAQERRGADWLPSIKAEFPLASWIVELVATRTADEALDAVAAAYPAWPIRALAGGHIKTLHARLRAEIDKPR